MLTIGEFSRLGRVSPRMLRYYDALGLLCPEQVGENGYRYYQQAQLETLLRIRRFQDYGFPLAQVGELLDMHLKRYQDDLLPIQKRYPYYFQT